MKTPALLLFMYVVLTSSLFAQEGFTDKVEAKNEWVKGVKEGKWIEFNLYLEQREGWHDIQTSEDREYRLLVYRGGIPVGIVREYQDGAYRETPLLNGKKHGVGKTFIGAELWKTTPYNNGLMHGIQYVYAEGKVSDAIPYHNNVMHGIAKTFDLETGKLTIETPYVNGKQQGLEKQYDAKGKLFLATLYHDGAEITTMTLAEIRKQDAFYKKSGIDSIAPDPVNYGDGIVYGFNRKTAKWGMFRVWGEITEILIPTKYDSLQFFGNAELTLVWNKGKAGTYYSPLIDPTAGETIPCIYDEVVLESGAVNAYVQKDTKWGLVSALTGEIIESLTYDSRQEVPSN